MAMNHIRLDKLPYCQVVRRFLTNRYGDTEGTSIWQAVQKQYNAWLDDMPDLGGKKNGHARAIYGGLLVFALYVSLPDQPPITELQGFVQNMFMAPFIKLGKVFNLNRSADMWIIDKVLRKSGNRDRKDAQRWPAGFINVDLKGMLFPGIIFALIPAALVGWLVTLAR